MRIFKSTFAFALMCLLLGLFVIPLIGRFWGEERYVWVLVYAAIGGMLGGCILAEVVSWIKPLLKRETSTE